MVKINCGYCEKGNEQVIDVITIEMERMESLLGDALVLWLIPCGVKREISALSRLRSELMIHLA